MKGADVVQHRRRRPWRGPWPADRSDPRLQPPERRPCRKAGPWNVPPHFRASPSSTEMPNKRAGLALGVLGRLAGLLQPVLLALLDPGVPGQEAGPLQRRPVLRVDQSQRPGDAQPQRARLPGDAAAGDRGRSRRTAPRRPRVTNGSLMSCWCTLFGKNSSSVRSLIRHWPVPGAMRTRAMASLRRPVPSALPVTTGLRAAGRGRRLRRPSRWCTPTRLARRLPPSSRRRPQRRLRACGLGHGTFLVLPHRLSSARHLLAVLRRTSGRRQLPPAGAVRPAARSG